MVKKFKDIIDKDEIVTVYGVSNNATKLFVRRLSLRKSSEPYWDWNVNDYIPTTFINLYYRGKNNRVTTIDRIRENRFNLNGESYKSNAYTYYLDVKKAAEILKSRIREKKHDLDKELMNIQKLISDADDNV